MNADELKAGQAHEMEHTDDPKEALKTAKDHLRKHARYYTWLKWMESQMKKSKLPPTSD